MIAPSRSSMARASLRFRESLLFWLTDKACRYIHGEQGVEPEVTVMPFKLAGHESLLGTRRK